jgi:hypothetical protein
MKIICIEVSEQVIIEQSIDKIILIGLSQGGLQARAVFTIFPDALPEESF